MLKRHLPSIEALTSQNDDLLLEELRLWEVYAEVAVARAFLDHLEQVVGCRIREQSANDADLSAANVDFKGNLQANAARH